MAPAAPGRRGPAPLRRCGRSAASLALALTLSVAVRHLGGAFVVGAPGRGPGRAGGAVARAAEAAEKKTKMYNLMVAATDHYVWRDENAFVGIVADAGEWTLDLDKVRAAYNKAKENQVAAVFQAPLYVVKAYVKELQNYGLMCEAIMVEEDKVKVEEAAWSARDWKELGPESKEAAGIAQNEAEAESGPSAKIWIKMSDHPTFKGDKTANMKFLAYVEMATDRIKKFAPEEGYLNQVYAKIRGPAGKAVVLDNLPVSSAEEAADQLMKAGFDVEVELDQKAEPAGGKASKAPAPKAKAPAPKAKASGSKGSGDLRSLLLD